MGPVSVTLYLPGFNSTFVPDELPWKELGEGLFPCTVMVKSDGPLLPQPSLITILVTINFDSRPGTNGLYLFVIIQLFVSPALITPLHSVE